jgi:hypothetical protein
MTLHASWFIISAVTLQWFLLAGCSLHNNSAWRNTIIAERVIDESVAALSRPSAVIARGDTAIIVFHADRVDPVIVDIRDGRVIGEVSASADLLDSALHDATALPDGLETPDLTKELLQGRFTWFDQQRMTTYRPHYQHGVLLSDTSAIFIALIPMPSIAWKSSERLEGIRQGLGLVEIDLRTLGITRCSLIGATDECAPQSFAMSYRNGRLVMGSLNAQRVIDGRSDSIHILARVSTTGQVEADRWYVPHAVLQTHSWFMLTQMWSTWRNQMLGVSPKGLALELDSQEQLAYCVFNVPRLTGTSTIAFAHPALASDMVEVALHTIDTSARDTSWSLIVFPTPSNSTANDSVLTVTKLTVSEIGPGCSIPCTTTVARNATFIRLVRRGERWLILKSIVTNTSL